MEQLIFKGSPLQKYSYFSEKFLNNKNEKSIGDRVLVLLYVIDEVIKEKMEGFNIFMFKMRRVFCGYIIKFWELT